MPVLTKEVEVIPIGKTIKHYRNLGYNAKHKEPIFVKVKDLPHTSTKVVEVLCDMCNKNTMYVGYGEYNKMIQTTGSYVCAECRIKKRMLTNTEKYGTPYPTQNEAVKSKIKQTCINRYGVESYTKTQECREKMNATCEEKYGKNYTKIISEKSRNSFYEKTGYKYISQSPEVKEKIKQAWFDKYGVYNLSQAPEIQEKKVKTYLKNYGVDNPNKSPEVREKTSKTLFQNSSQKASKQQYYINNLYKGILNFPVKYYNVDIYLPDDNLIVEYDGGGHMLNVVTGRETIEEYNHKEIVRYNVIKREGYKQMKIISLRDFLPSDNVLLQMLAIAKEYFNTTSHSWINFDIDNSIIVNAENKENGGMYFNYGELHTIKDVS